MGVPTRLIMSCKGNYFWASFEVVTNVNIRSDLLCREDRCLYACLVTTMWVIAPAKANVENVIRSIINQFASPSMSQLRIHRAVIEPKYNYSVSIQNFVADYENICICDWICKKASYMHNYIYLEIPLWNIQFVLSQECTEQLVCISPLI